MMRNAALIVLVFGVAVATGCGDDDNGIECIENANCNLDSTGQCVQAPSGRKWCAYGDTACPSGFRYADRDVGDGLAGMCVAEELPDGAVPDGPMADAGLNDAMADASVADADVNDAGACSTRIVYEHTSGTNIDVFTIKPDGSGRINISNDPADDRAPSVSPQGKIAFVSERTGNWDVLLHDDGVLTNLTMTPASETEPQWSPDGSKITYTRDGSVWAMNLDGTNQAELASGLNDTSPYWSPAGDKIVFSSAAEIYTVDAAGGGRTNITNTAGTDYGPRWSPTGAKIVYSRTTPGPNVEVYTMNPDGTSKTNLTNSVGPDFSAEYSPDGTKIAFVSSRTGNDEIYVMNADGGAQTKLTNNAFEDRNPMWSPDGSRIAFVSDRDGNSEIYVMNADGSGQTNVTNDPENDDAPTWIVCP